MAIHEVFVLTDEIRDQISRGVSLLEMRKEAARLGFRSLRYDGILKAMLGLTTLEEVNRATGD
jgi:type IV pilus assembly protein PilB